MSSSQSRSSVDENFTPPIIPRLSSNRNFNGFSKKPQGYNYIRVKSKVNGQHKILAQNSQYNSVIYPSSQNYELEISSINQKQHSSEYTQQKYTIPFLKRPISSYEPENQTKKANLNHNFKLTKRHSVSFMDPQNSMQKICLKMAQSIIFNPLTSQITDQKTQINNKISNEQFIRIKFLGQGKFGQVYLVKHKYTGFICALKIIDKNIVRQQNVESQIAKQIRIQSQLRSMNIIDLYGYFDDQTNFYILLEYASQGSVFSKLKGRSRLQESQIQPIAKGICDGLKFIHKMGFVHRDIKPQNIVLQFGVPKICDFGWATNCDQMQLCKSYCGTPLYISPQMIRKQFYGTSVDIWAVGMIVYQLLVGRVPFRIWNQQDMNQILIKSIEFPQYIDRSQNCQSFIRKCLQKITVYRIQLSQALKHPFIYQSAQPEIEYQFFEIVKNVLNTSY